MVRVASVFSQILTLLHRSELHAAVREHWAGRYAKRFTCWEQFVEMLFWQLAQPKSPRVICSGLARFLGKLQHLGVETIM